jgi:hypothetical protein
MKKGVVYLGAAVVGIGGAVLAFTLMGDAPSDPSGGGSDRQVEEGPSGGDGPAGPAARADKRDATNVDAEPQELPPEKAAVQQLLSSDFGSHALSAGPSFQGLARELSNPDAAALCKEQASILRSLRSKPDVDVRTVIEGERACLDAARVGQPSAAGMELIDSLDAMVNELEASAQAQ